MLKYKSAAKIILIISFFFLFILLNYWIINHNGLVGLISKLTISHFGYWSPALSVGLPIVLGLLVFLGAWAALLIKKQIIYIDHNGVEKNEINADTLKELSRLFIQKMQGLKYALVFIVVGIELMAFDVIQNLELVHMNKVPVECSFLSIQNKSCRSGYVALPIEEPSEKRVYLTVEKSSRDIHYYRPQGVFNVFLMEKTIRKEHPRFISLHDVKGVVEKIDPSDELLIRSEYKDVSGEVFVIDPELDPNNISWVQTVVAGIMLLVGVFLFYRKTKIKATP